MRYEQEILDLIPMLESYLKKISQYYNGLIDADDALQECLLNALQVSDKKYIRHPRNYFIGVFDTTIKMIGKREVAEHDARKNLTFVIPERRFKYIPEIDSQVKKMPEHIQDIWFFLKQFEGNINKTSKVVKKSYQAVWQGRERIRKIYNNVRIS